MTLGARRCDVIMGYPQGDEAVRTPSYYRSTYALVFKPGTGNGGMRPSPIRDSSRRSSASWPEPRRPRAWSWPA
jgi:hypothetical protein